ncbi:MAG: MarR family transcriptional regulator [Clostridia bacterium]|nr:MarR family transcriptional regulator [Clostridia bacterium]
MNSMEFKSELEAFSKLLTQALDNAFRPIIESFGLTTLQVRVLTEIYRNEKATVGSLINIIGSSGNASTLCKKLEKSGFIVRQRDATDERVVNLALTDYGKDTLKEIEKAIHQKLVPVLEKKSEEDFAVILDGIKKMKEILEEINLIK